MTEDKHHQEPESHNNASQTFPAEALPWNKNCIKTRLCIHYTKGFCLRGSACLFAHSAKELQRNSRPGWKSQHNRKNCNSYNGSRQQPSSAAYLPKASDCTSKHNSSSKRPPPAGGCLTTHSEELCLTPPPSARYHHPPARKILQHGTTRMASNQDVVFRDHEFPSLNDTLPVYFFEKKRNKSESKTTTTDEEHLHYCDDSSSSSHRTSSTSSQPLDLKEQDFYRALDFDGPLVWRSTDDNIEDDSDWLLLQTRHSCDNWLSYWGEPRFQETFHDYHDYWGEPRFQETYLDYHAEYRKLMESSMGFLAQELFGAEPDKY
jgi:hypothetical protein